MQPGGMGGRGGARGSGMGGTTAGDGSAGGPSGIGSRDAGPVDVAQGATTPDAAGPDMPPLGPAAGALEVTTGEKVVNECVSLVSTVGDEVTLDGSVMLPAGATLLVWQIQDRFATVGDGGDVTSTARIGNAGVWELARVVSTRTDGTRLAVKLAGKPKISYATDSAAGKVAQACTVPEYSQVTVAEGARIVAAPWDGKKGGVVAFSARGTVTVDGAITATGLGFRGGPWDAKAFHRDDYPNRRLTDLNTKDALGGRKGEGLEGGAFGLTKEGRGNYANGAGGGNNTHAGGGGGANAGKGGFGGMQHGFYGAGEPNTRGMGGAAVKLPLRERLVMGGGGGQGQQVTATCNPTWCKPAGFATKSSDLTHGAPGGGVVLVTAAALRGKGSLSADGVRGGCAECDGAGGGGAGGSILIKATDAGFTGTISARGGLGGDNLNSNSRVGPGGGGGGGRIRLEVPDAASLKTEVAGGTGGWHYCGGGPGKCPGRAPTDKNHYGATDGTAGVVEAE